MLDEVEVSRPSMDTQEYLSNKAREGQIQLYNPDLTYTQGKSCWIGYRRLILISELAQMCFL